MTAAEMFAWLGMSVLLLWFVVPVSFAMCAKMWFDAKLKFLLRTVQQAKLQPETDFEVPMKRSKGVN